MARAIVVPPALEPDLRRLVERMTRANGGDSPAACERAVEVSVLKRGIEELSKDLRDFDAAGAVKPTDEVERMDDELARIDRAIAPRGGKVA